MYACECAGGAPETFDAQTAWIAEQREALNIVYVAQSPFGDADGSSASYNATFGVDRFSGRSWYGGHQGDNNDNQPATFSAAGLDFLVLDLEYDYDPSAEVLAWALAVVAEHPEHKVIVAAHYLLGLDGGFGTQGAAVYEALKAEPGFVMMVAGHVPGEARRSDTFEERTVHTLLADYQSRDNGGDGWLRGMTFVPDEDRVDVWTWSPTLGVYETDADSSFSLDLDLSVADTGGDDAGSGDEGGDAGDEDGGGDDEG